MAPIDPFSPHNSTDSSLANFGNSSSADQVEAIANQDFTGLLLIAASLINSVGQLGVAINNYLTLPTAGAVDLTSESDVAEKTVYQENIEDFLDRIESKISVGDSKGRDPQIIIKAFRKALKVINREEGSEDLTRYCLENCDKIILSDVTPDTAQYWIAENTFNFSHCSFIAENCSPAAIIHEFRHFVEITNRTFVHRDFFEKCFDAISEFANQAMDCAQAFNESCRDLYILAQDFLLRKMVSRQKIDKAITDGNVVLISKDVGKDFVYHMPVGVYDKVKQDIDSTNMREVYTLYSASRHEASARNAFKQYRDPKDTKGSLLESLERGPYLTSAATSKVLEAKCRSRLQEEEYATLPPEEAQEFEKLFQPAVITKSAAERLELEGVWHTSRIIADLPLSLKMGRKKPSPNPTSPRSEIKASLGRSEF